MQSRSRRRGRLDITAQHQFDNVVYLGHCQSTVDIGRQGALDAVAALWNALPVGMRAVKAFTGPIRPGPETAWRLLHALPKVSVAISTCGIAVWEPGAGDQKDDGDNYGKEVKERNGNQTMSCVLRIAWPVDGDVYTHVLRWLLILWT